METYKSLADARRSRRLFLEIQGGDVNAANDIIRHD